MEINQRLQKIRKQTPTRLSDQRGMTFQELIVIMVIIAIISLIVAPQIVGTIQSVRFTATGRTGYKQNPVRIAHQFHKTV